MFAVLLLFAGISEAVYAWPKVSLPPQVGFKQTLAEEMFVNGVPMKITHFKSRLSVDQVLNYYRNRWGEKFAESEFDGWQQISQYRNNYFITVQIKTADVVIDGQYTLGRLNISNFDVKSAKEIKEFPMLNDSKIINNVETVDKDKSGRVLLFLNRQALEENAEYYKNHFTSKGWAQTMAQQVGLGARVYVFKKDKGEVTINIRSIEGGSSVMVNEVFEKSWFN